ncbi:hypothetical protein AHAS_Ahas10G0003600 [Arachis hypogaea]
MASVPLFLVCFLLFSAEMMAMAMEEEELLGLFEVMEALLDDPEWSQAHPQPCTETPWPGVECEVSTDDPQNPIFHITKIHIGPDIVSPPCKSSAYISKSLIKLSYLKTLSIFNCFVDSPVTLPSTLFGSFSSLEHLALQSNPTLNGELPSSLAEVSSLRVLSLSQNSFHGKIPRKIGSLPCLEQLDLSYNNFSGQIPLEIGGLKSLTILDISFNGIEGNLPHSLGQLKQLQKMDLSSNRLDGRIPFDLGMLKRLVLLDLSHNFIVGPIPQSLSSLENLEYLIMDDNPIKARIPFFIGSLLKLKSVSFSRCGLVGPIPNSFSALKNLSALSLDNNSLTGQVPSNLGLLPNLDQLNISNNMLYGVLELNGDFIAKLGERVSIVNTGRMKKQITNVNEYEGIAKEKLPKMVYDYYASGAEDQWTLKENRNAFSRILLRPRILVDVSNVDMTTSILGFKISMPIMIAPTGMQKMAHPQGELATARAASEADTIMTLSTVSTCSIEEVASTGPGIRFFQLYVYKDRNIAAQLVKRAEKAGFKGIVLTVDRPFLGRKEDDIKNRFRLPPHLTLKNFEKNDGTGGSIQISHARGQIDPSLNWKDVKWLQTITSLPILVKGVLTAVDARLAIENGAAGIIVSNHGARQLDYVPATIMVLEEIVEAVEGRVPVLVDGGIRRGTDVFKALALGACGVFIGRAVVFSLAVDGEAGVRKVLKMLRDELEMTMALSGCPSLKDITRDRIKFACSL